MGPFFNGEHMAFSGSRFLIAVFLIAIGGGVSKFVFWGQGKGRAPGAGLRALGQLPFSNYFWSIRNVRLSL